MKKTCQTLEDTKAFAAEVAKGLHGGELVLIDGELGAGKTAFVQGMAEGLGADTGARSPTFTVMNVYKTSHPTIRELVHLDFYRLTKPEEAAHLGLEDWLGRADTVVAAEWPPEAWPVPPGTPVIRVMIAPERDGSRQISIARSAAHAR